MGTTYYTMTSGVDANNYWVSDIYAYDNSDDTVAYREAKGINDEVSKWIEFSHNHTISGVYDIRNVCIGLTSYVTTTSGWAGQQIVVTPTFSGLGDGLHYSVNQSTTSTEYIIDITYDPNAPDPWTYQDIMDLKFRIHCNTTDETATNTFNVDSVFITVTSGTLVFDEFISDSIIIHDSVTTSGGEYETYFIDDHFDNDLSSWTVTENNGGVSATVSGGHLFVETTNTDGWFEIEQYINDSPYITSLQVKFGDTTGILPYIYGWVDDNVYGASYLYINAPYKASYTLSGGPYHDMLGDALYTTYSGTYAITYYIHNDNTGYGIDYSISEVMNIKTYYNGGSSVSVYGSSASKAIPTTRFPYFRFVEVLDKTIFSTTVYSSNDGETWQKEVDYTKNDLNSLQRNTNLSFSMGAFVGPSTSGVTNSGVGIFKQSWDYFLNTSSIE